MALSNSAVRSLAGRYFFTPRGLAASAILILIIAGTDLLSPWLVMEAIDRIVAHSSSADSTAVSDAFNTVLVLAGIMVAAVLIQSIARYALTRVQNRMIYRGVARLRSDLHERLQAQGLAFHAERRIGALLTHLVNDTQALQDAAVELAAELPFDACTLAGLVIAMSLLNPTLCAIVSLFLLVVILVSVRMTRAGMESQSTVMSNSETLIATLHESLSSQRVLSTFNAGSEQNTRVAESTESQATELENAGELRAMITPFFGLAEYAGILVVLVLGGWFTLHGTLTAGGLVAFLAYMEMAAEPMSRCAQMLPRLQKAAVSASRLSKLLSDSQSGDNDAGLTPSSIEGRLRVEHLLFSHATSTEPTLQEISFEVRPGERIAIVGSNAAGKSTLLDLLLKLYQPAAGRILIDNYDLQELSTAGWRRIVGVVPQDCMLLNRTIAENIALGAANLSQVREAAQLAGIDEQILRLPKGYDTTPGERGVHLSGGERQRIAIARLFLRNPRVVLLDEPTSALDMQGESELLPSIERLCSGRTTLIVSHRTRVLSGVDRVLLLADGRLLAFDSPESVWQRFPGSRALFPSEWGQRHVPVH